MAEALMLRAPTSRLATQIRTHARVLASLKLRPAPGEYSCAAAVQPRPTQDRAERDVSLTSEERAKLDREQQQGEESAGAAPAAAPEETPLLSTGKTALRAATTTKPSTSQVSLHRLTFDFFFRRALTLIRSVSSTSTDDKHVRLGTVPGRVGPHEDGARHPEPLQILTRAVRFCAATRIKTCRPLRRVVFAPGRHQQQLRSRTVRKVPDRGRGPRADEGGMQTLRPPATKAVSASDAPTCAREQGPSRFAIWIEPLILLAT